MEIKIFENEQDFIERSVNFIAKVCRKKADIIRIALSGGSTPKPIYTLLGDQENVPFEKVEFYQVDERCIDSDSLYSNQKMIKETLMKKKESQKIKFYAFDISAKISVALKIYEDILGKLSQPFDLTILGIGSDGHIASLFPGTAALLENKKLVLHTRTATFDVTDRLTLTLKPILDSSKILVLLAGPGKEQILAKLQDPTLDDISFPAKKLLSHPDCTIHYLRFFSIPPESV